MPTNRQVKKKAQSFSISDEEMEAILARASALKLDRNKYLLALHEADKAIPLGIALHTVSNDLILTPAGAAGRAMDALTNFLSRASDTERRSVSKRPLHILSDAEAVTIATAAHQKDFATVFRIIATVVPDIASALQEGRIIGLPEGIEESTTPPASTGLHELPGGMSEKKPIQVPAGGSVVPQDPGIVKPQKSKTGPLRKKKNAS